MFELYNMRGLPLLHYQSLSINGSDSIDLKVPINFHRLIEKDKFKYYRELFALALEQEVIDEIRESTNKCWVLGNKEFKSVIEQKLNRKSAPSERGGDHKSVKYREKKKKINRV